MTVSPDAVYLADIFEGGTRPVVIVSRETLNRGGLYLAAPITSSRIDERRKYQNYVFLPAGTGGLRQDSVAVTHLVQPVRSEFLQAHWGTLPAPLLQRVLVGIVWSIGLGADASA